MFVGHYAAAFVAKRIEPETPLWSLVLAVQAVDVAWALLVLAGVEKVRLDPSLPSNPLDLYYMPYTHGLPATLLWMLAAFLVGRAWLGRSGPALALAAATGSHWLLDLLVHRPDLPLWDDAHKVGLALWNHPLGAAALELGLLVATALALARSGALDRARRRAFSVFVAGLVVAHLVVVLGATPPRATALVAGALVFYLTLAWIARRVAP